VAETLYAESLEKMKNTISFTKVMAMNLFGRLLLKNKKREQEGVQMLKLSEDIAKRLPFWYDKIDYIYIPEFDLE